MPSRTFAGSVRWRRGRARVFSDGSIRFQVELCRSPARAVGFVGSRLPDVGWPGGDAGDVTVNRTVRSCALPVVSGTRVEGAGGNGSNGVSSFECWVGGDEDVVADARSGDVGTGVNVSCDVAVDAVDVDDPVVGLIGSWCVLSMPVWVPCLATDVVGIVAGWTGGDSSFMSVDSGAFECCACVCAVVNSWSVLTAGVFREFAASFDEFEKDAAGTGSRAEECGVRTERSGRLSL